MNAIQSELFFGEAPTPPLPRGIAKVIVGNMLAGESLVILPAWVCAFQEAACLFRDLGWRISFRFCFNARREPRHRMTRVR